MYINRELLAANQNPGWKFLAKINSTGKSLIIRSHDNICDFVQSSLPVKYNDRI